MAEELICVNVGRGRFSQCVKNDTFSAPGSSTSSIYILYQQNHFMNTHHSVLTTRGTVTGLHRLPHPMHRPLPLRLKPVLLEAHRRHTHRHLLLALTQLTPCALNILRQWDTNVPSILDIWLVLGVVQFCLYGRRQELDSFDGAGAVEELLT